MIERVCELEKLNVENSDTLEEFEYLAISDYFIRTDSYFANNERVFLYDSTEREEEQEMFDCDPKVFNTTLEEMVSVLAKWGFKKNNNLIKLSDIKNDESLYIEIKNNEFKIMTKKELLLFFNRRNIFKNIYTIKYDLNNKEIVNKDKYVYFDM